MFFNVFGRETKWNQVRILIFWLRIIEESQIFILYLTGHNNCKIYFGGHFSFLEKIHVEPVRDGGLKPSKEEGLQVSQLVGT